MFNLNLTNLVYPTTSVQGIEEQGKWHPKETIRQSEKVGHCSGHNEFFNKSMALKKKVLETILDYKRLLKNKTKCNTWILLGWWFEHTSCKWHFGENWGNFNIDQVLDYIKKLLILLGVIKVSLWCTARAQNLRFGLSETQAADLGVHKTSSNPNLPGFTSAGRENHCYRNISG